VIQRTDKFYSRSGLALNARVAYKRHKSRPDPIPHVSCSRSGAGMCSTSTILRAHRHALGGPPQGDPSGCGALSADAVPLHRAESRAGGDGANGEGYRWSSYRCNALGQADPVITPHARYLALHRSEDEGREAYRALFRAHLDPEEESRIRRLSEMGMPLGNDRFQARIEELTGLRLGQAKRGRPRKQIAGVGDVSE
jgi:hypothetical protein